jgi:hypothetical protein
MNFIHSLQSEWLKKKNSAASWLTVTGAFLVPLIMFVARMVESDQLYKQVHSPRFWEAHFNNSWQFMAMFLLPMGVILATVLITQLEYKNNAWKQLHTTPQTYTTVFFSKMIVIFLMLAQFFILFNIGIWLSGVLPSLIFRGIPFPVESIPFMTFFKTNIRFFIDCLPIIALQYLLSLQFKNFLAPLGIGIGLVVASMIALSWKLGYILPYIYCMLSVLLKQSAVDQKININLWATVYFLIITSISYILYLRKKEKG